MFSVGAVELRSSTAAAFATLSTLVTLVVGSACVVTGCADAPSTSTSEDDSSANGVDCDVRYDQLEDDHLAGIAILEPTAQKISRPQKIRHLNELDKTSASFLRVLRTSNVPIELTGGAITNFEEWVQLKGQTPPGWEGTGLTWDSVPGTGTEAGLFLGDSAKPNNAYSLAIHEATHSVDLSRSFTAENAQIQSLYAQELTRPEATSDLNARYRRSNIREFLAVAVDEFYCSGRTRARLLSLYPQMHAYLANDFDAALDATAAPSSSPPR